MANFKTHLMVGCVASGVLTTSLVAIRPTTSSEAILVFVSGAMGSLLPDIDSDRSIPIRLAANILGLVAGFMTLISLNGQHLSILELLLVWGGIYLIVRYPLFYIFAEFSVHRGVFHSIPAALFFCFLWAIFLYDLAGLAAFPAWLSGAALAFGYCVHLLLDEYYSVDLLGATIKRSFGSAFKLFSMRYWVASIALYASIVGLSFFVPPHEHFLDFFADPKTYSTLLHSFFPK